jgi:hypothetical protein
MRLKFKALSSGIGSAFGVKLEKLGSKQQFWTDEDGLPQKHEIKLLTKRRIT